MTSHERSMRNIISVKEQWRPSIRQISAKSSPGIVWVSHLLVGGHTCGRYKLNPVEAQTNCWTTVRWGWKLREQLCMSEAVKHISCVLCCSAVCPLWCQQCLLLQTVSKWKSVESQEIKWKMLKFRSFQPINELCVCVTWTHTEISGHQMLEHFVRPQRQMLKLLFIHSSNKQQSDSWNCT